jgi:hypothetical protein
MEVPGIKDAHPLSESERYKGYDIVVFKMPDNEYQHILNNPEHSFVYVVTNAFSDPMLHIIPGTALWGLMPTRITIWWSDWSSKVRGKWKPSI